MALIARHFEGNRLVKKENIILKLVRLRESCWREDLDQDDGITFINYHLGFLKVEIHQAFKGWVNSMEINFT